MDKTTPQDKAKNAPDWERIELDYRAGIKTLQQIADENGISHAAVHKRAKRDTGNMRVEEKALHQQFAQKRVRGEWFCLDDGDLEFIAKRSKLV